MRTTPTRRTGRARTVARDGRSPKSSHAATPTRTTWRLPRTVASPAPTASIAWCQKRRSPAKKTPATTASRTVEEGSDPKRRCSAQARRARIGSPYAARKNVPVDGLSWANR
jgi:hypothetical protein